MDNQPASTIDLIHSLDWVLRYRRDLSAADTSGHAYADQEEASIRALLAKRRRQQAACGVAALDMRPTSAWPLPRRVTGDGA